jgi:ABC-type transport system involved in multi-copper enzyme maturation permease subunit
VTALRALVVYAVRLAVPRRLLLLLLPLAGGVLLGLLARLSPDSATDAYDQVTRSGMHTVVLPLTCLVVGDAVLGAELRAGSFALTWISPVHRWTIVLARWLAGWGVAIVLVVPATAMGALVAGSPERVGPAVVAAVAGTAAYLAVFLAMGAGLRRAVVWMLVLIGVVEPALGGLSSRVAQVSPEWLSLNVLAGLSGADTRDGVPAGWGAVVRLAVLTAVALVVAIAGVRRLRAETALDE